jgi:hypothetical protein
MHAVMGLTYRNGRSSCTGSNTTEPAAHARDAANPQKVRAAEWRKHVECQANLPSTKKQYSTFERNLDGGAVVAGKGGVVTESKACTHIVNHVSKKPPEPNILVEPAAAPPCEH